MIIKIKDYTDSLNLIPKELIDDIRKYTRELESTPDNITVTLDFDWIRRLTLWHLKYILEIWNVNTINKIPKICDMIESLKNY